MTGQGCADVEDQLPELALGVLTGTDRDRALAHLAGCPTCRSRLDALASTVDTLLSAGPVTEPPPGFEARVIDRIASEDRLRRRRRWSRPLIAVAACLALVVGGVAVGRASAPTTHTGSGPVRSAAMTTPDGRRVGRAVVGTAPDTVFVAVPGWSPGPRWSSGAAATDAYLVRVSMKGRPPLTLGPVTLTGGTWVATAAFRGGEVRRVAIVDRSGREYCGATLPAVS